MTEAYRPWEVTFQVTQRIKFIVDARTPEEAEETANIYFAEGEEGIKDGPAQTELEEVVPVEELTSDEIFKSDPTGHY